MPGLGSSPVSDAVAQTLHQATLTLLERTGVRIGSDHARDFELRRVYPQEEHIQEALTTAPRRIRVYGHGTGSPVVMEGEKVYVLAGGGSLRVLNLEGQFEASTWEHLRQFNVLLDALPNIHPCINQVAPQDDEGDGFYVRLAAEMLIGMPKPCLLQAFGASDVTATLETGVATRGSRQALVERPVFMVAAAYSGDVVHRFRSSHHQWTTCHRNKWPTSVGTGGRHAPESLVGMGRIMQLLHLRWAQA